MTAKFYFGILLIITATLLYFFGATHAWWPTLTRCQNTRAITLAKDLSNIQNWSADNHHVTRKDGRVQIWWANSVYGLGVEEGPYAYAMPNEGNLSLACRSLIFLTLEPYARRTTDY